MGVALHTTTEIGHSSPKKAGSNGEVEMEWVSVAALSSWRQMEISAVLSPRVSGCYVALRTLVRNGSTSVMTVSSLMKLSE